MPTHTPTLLHTHTQQPHGACSILEIQDFVCFAHFDAKSNICAYRHTTVCGRVASHIRKCIYKHRICLIARCRPLSLSLPRSVGYVCSYVCYNFDIPFAFGLALFSCVRVEINDAPFQKVSYYRLLEARKETTWPTSITELTHKRIMKLFTVHLCIVGQTVCSGNLKRFFANFEEYLIFRLGIFIYSF